MKVGFYHDFRVYRGSDGSHRSLAFPYELWTRYLSVFDSLQVTCRLDNEIDDGLPISSGENVEFLTVVKDSANRLSVLSNIKLKGQLQKSIQNQDAVIVRLPSRIGRLAAKEARRQRKPILAEVVGCAKDALWFHSLRGKMLAFPSFLTTRIAVRKADAVVYVTREFLQSRYPTRGVSTSCSDVFLPDFAKSEMEEILEKQRIKNSASVKLVTVGDVGVRYKGHADVLRSMVRLKQRGLRPRYLLIGGGDSTRLKTLVSQLELETEVKFLGALPWKETIEVLKNDTDIYIQPSRTEGLPRAVIEAMSVACPVIATKVGGIPELLEEQALYAPGDIDRLTSLIEDFCLSSEAQSRYNYALVRREFDGDRLDSKREQLLRRFREICS